MKLLVVRNEFSEKSTVGSFYVDDKKFCYTLEDTVRSGPKVPGATAIPTGIYTVIVDKSKRFNRDMPHILDVQGFEGIRIHSGNTDKDTEGCVLLGTTWLGGDFIGGSRAAFDKFFDILQAAIRLKEQITIEIK